MSVFFVYLWNLCRRRTVILASLALSSFLCINLLLNGSNRKTFISQWSTPHNISRIEYLNQVPLPPSKRLLQNNSFKNKGEPSTNNINKIGYDQSNNIETSVRKGGVVFLPINNVNDLIESRVDRHLDSVAPRPRSPYHGGKLLTMEERNKLIAPQPVVSSFDNAEYKLFYPGENHPPPFIRAEMASPAPPLYLPPTRLIHFDLKGAPPKVDFILKVLRMSKKLGATGVLMEYEDTFPFEAQLSLVRVKNHYTRNDIQKILQTCADLGLEVIPLVQTFGHMEFILKLKEFAHLRDVPEMPESICACHTQAMPLIQLHIDQVMALHKDVKYLHIGCDEVFHLGECEPCQKQSLSRDSIFVNHVHKVASYVKKKYGVNVIVWHDMVQSLQPNEMERLSGWVEPMVWVYALEVDRLMSNYNWDRLAQVFDTVWTASAFKGAHGPTLVVPPIQKHLSNTLSWLNVMAVQEPKFRQGFRGLVLTGWQRYDHFAVLCEILPVSIPSLAINLIVASNGFFNSSLQRQIYDGLDCVLGDHQPLLDGEGDLESDPYLWDEMSRCSFPGASAFSLTRRIKAVQDDVDAYLVKTAKNEAWLTDYNSRYSYSSPFRVAEGLQDFPKTLSEVTSVLGVTKTILSEFFDQHTVAEWIEQQIYPMYCQLNNFLKKAESLRSKRYWPKRPFGSDEVLAEMGLVTSTSIPAGLRTPQTQRPKRLVQQPDYYRNPS